MPVLAPEDLPKGVLNICTVEISMHCSDSEVHASKPAAWPCLQACGRR